MNAGQVRQSRLEVSDLVIGYSGQLICGPIDFSLPQGASLGIIGANGSGKSTLLRTILGTLPPVSGTVEFNALPLDEGSLAFRRHVAVQVSDGAFFEELSVAEHLEMVARGHGLTRWQAKVAAELDFFELSQVADHLPAELSSGQRRKLLLAAALIRPADLLVLDEPEQRLDLRIREKLYARLARLREDSVSILAVTHDPRMLRGCLEQAFLLDGDSGSLSTPELGAQWLER